MTARGTTDRAPPPAGCKTRCRRWVPRVVVPRVGHCAPSMPSSFAPAPVRSRDCRSADVPACDCGVHACGNVCGCVGAHVLGAGGGVVPTPQVTQGAIYTYDVTVPHGSAQPRPLPLVNYNSKAGFHPHGMCVPGLRAHGKSGCAGFRTGGTDVVRWWHLARADSWSPAQTPRPPVSLS
jgi:hypothetical protein